MKRYFLDIMTCRACSLKLQCTKSEGQRRIARWEHQDQIDCMDDVMASMPGSMLIRKQTVEHPYGTIKFWMGSTLFLLMQELHASIHCRVALIFASICHEEWIL